MSRDFGNHLDDLGDALGALIECRHGIADILCALIEDIHPLHGNAEPLLSLDGGSLRALRCRRDIRDPVGDIVDGMRDPIHRLEGLVDDLALLDGAARDLDDCLGCVLRPLCRLICRCGQLFGGSGNLLCSLCRALNEFAQPLDHR